MSSINPYSSYLRSYSNNTPTTYRKKSWQTWVDHSDIDNLNKNVPKGTYWEAVPLHESHQQYAGTKIPNTKTQLEAFNNLQSIDGQPVKELRAVNNVLRFEIGSFYRYNICEGQSVILSAQGCGPNISYEGVAAEFGTDIGVFTTGTYRAFAQINLLMQALSGFPDYFQDAFSSSERLELYAQLGIEAGGWVEIQNGDDVNRFYLDENGNNFSEFSSEDTRNNLNSRDWRQAGIDVLIIDGKEYRIDENGSFNIPEGVPCVWNVTIFTSARYARLDQHI